MQIDPSKGILPRLDKPTPDKGLVHPYGDVPAEDEVDEPDVDVPIWLCSSCGFEWQRGKTPTQCPNCASTDSFLRADS
ncbi:MAG: hypothetical protein ACYDDF_14070 [Thermoplasmatota archaeon]